MTYELNNIYNTDSYKAIKDIPDKSIDLVIIDPPYDIQHTTGGGMLEEKGIRNMFDNLVENNITNAFDFDTAYEYGLIDAETRDRKEKEFSYFEGGGGLWLEYVEDQCRYIVDQLEGEGEWATELK